MVHTDKVGCCYQHCSIAAVVEVVVADSEGSSPVVRSDWDEMLFVDGVGMGAVAVVAVVAGWLEEVNWVLRSPPWLLERD